MGIENIEKDEGCLHCPHNENAVKPYVKMTRIPFTTLPSQILNKVEREGKNPSCFICEIVTDFVKELKKDGNDKD